MEQQTSALTTVDGTAGFCLPGVPETIATDHNLLATFDATGAMRGAAGSAEPVRAQLVVRTGSPDRASGRVEWAASSSETASVSGWHNADYVLWRCPTVERSPRRNAGYNVVISNHSVRSGPVAAPSNSTTASGSRKVGWPPSTRRPTFSSACCSSALRTCCFCHYRMTWTMADLLGFPREDLQVDCSGAPGTRRLATPPAKQVGVFGKVDCVNGSDRSTTWSGAGDTEWPGQLGAPPSTGH
jgi:hypothetical protein